MRLPDNVFKMLSYDTLMSRNDVTVVNNSVQGVKEEVMCRDCLRIVLHGSENWRCRRQDVLRYQIVANIQLWRHGKRIAVFTG